MVHHRRDDGRDCSPLGRRVFRLAKAVKVEVHFKAHGGGSVSAPNKANNKSDGTGMRGSRR